MYHIYFQIWKCEAGVLARVESLHILLYESTRGIFKFCETVYIISSLSTSGVNSVGLYFIGIYCVIMLVNIVSFEIEPTLLDNPENLLKTSCISGYGRQLPEWSIFLVYLPKILVETGYLILVRTHFSSSSCIRSNNYVWLKIFTNESVK